MTGGGHYSGHTGRTRSVSEAEQEPPRKQTVCLLGGALQIRPREPALKTVKSQGLIRSRNDGPGCSIPGLSAGCVYPFLGFTAPQTAVSVQGSPQDHSQGSGVQGSDLPENERKLPLREVWGPDLQGPGQLISAMGKALWVCSFQRTKVAPQLGKGTRIQPRAPRSRRPLRRPPTSRQVGTSEPLAFMWS